jgi:hypothetical protein
MIRLAIYGLLLSLFADALRRALQVQAYSLVLPLALVIAVLLVLIVRHWKFLRRRLDRNRTDFVRPRSFPAQRKRDVR